MIERFLEHVLPTKGLYCIAVPQKTGDGAPYYKHRVVKTISEAATAAKQMDAAGAEVFFAVGSLKEPKIWNPNKKAFDGSDGKWEVRSHANMAFHKSLIFDIDCGEGKPYETQTEALAALKHVVKETSLPKPTIVSSGGGLHVYFTLTEDIPSDVWYAFATRIKAIAKQFKLKIDNSRTSDRSSVLRVVGTHNRKKSEAREVKVLVWGSPTDPKTLQSTIKKVIKFYNIEVNNPAKPLSEVQKLFADVESNIDEGRLADSSLIFTRCAQMAYVKENGGPSGYNLRGAAISILKFTVDPDYSIVEANDPDPAKVIAQTDAFLQASVTQHPNTCDRFADFEQGHLCESCAYRGKIKSPIVLGYKPEELPAPVKPVQEELSVYQGKKESVEQKANAIQTVMTVAGYEITLPPPPYPYKRTAKGVLMEEYDADGPMSDVVVYQYDLYPYEMVDEGNEFTIKVVIDLPMDQRRTASFPISAFTDLKTFAKLMANNGVLPVQGTEILMNYMKAYINEIQRVAKATKHYMQLGWHEDGDRFVLPSKSILSDGSSEDCGASSAISTSVKGFRKRGTLEEWKKVIDAYARPGYEGYQFGHLGGYGSLLFRFTPYDGGIINFVGDSGSGKSTILQTINSLFGHPKELWLVHHDKYLAKINRLGVFNSICATYDEITNCTPEELSDLCYSVTQGRGRMRLTQDAKERENNTTWKLLLVSSSNSNIIDKLAALKHDASAESLRVFEYPIMSTNVMTKQQATETFDALNENFGHAGEIFIQYVIQNQEKVKKLIRDLTEKFDIAADVPIRERYWSSIVACCLAGGIIAKKLGLCSFDMQKLFEWAVQQVRVMRGVVKENTRDPRALLVEYMNQHLANTIVIGGDGKRDYVLNEPRAGLLVRCEIDHGFAYITKSHIRNYLVKGGADYNHVKKTLEESGILVKSDCTKVLSMGSGTIRTGQARCWMIDLNHREMQGTVLLGVDEKAVKAEQETKALFANERSL